MAKRRRKFTKEYKREVVKLFRDSGKGVTAMAKELGISLTVLRSWIEMVESEERTGLTPDELEELKQLRKDNARLQMEVEILGKATASSTGHRYTCVERPLPGDSALQGAEGEDQRLLRVVRQS